MSTPNDQLNDFERALLADLRCHVALREEEATQTTADATRLRRWGTRFGLAAAAAATIGSISLLSGGTSAYAVDTANDGTVTVRILDRSDATGLEAALAEHGITADVDYSGHSAVSVLTGSTGKLELVPTDDTPLANDAAGKDASPNAPTLQTVSLGDKLCPGTDAAEHTIGDMASPPIAAERSGDGFVVTLTGPAVEEGADLQLVIYAGGYTEGVAGLYTDGSLSCGAATAWGSVR